MTINFDINNSLKASNQDDKYHNLGISKSGNKYGVTESEKVMPDSAGFVMTLGQNDRNSVGNNEKENQTDFQNAIGVTDVQLNRDYMSVMSLSMSDEDYAEMVRTGQMPEDMELGDSVTILDDIKAAIIKGGTNVEGYTDNLNRDVIEKITGSVAMADEIIKNMHAQDISPSEENIALVSKSIDEANAVLPLSDEAMHYMMENHVSPTVSNIYHASHSSNYAINVHSVSNGDLDALSSQIEEVIRRSGHEINDEIFADAKWMIEKGLPLTPESLNEFESYARLREGLSEREVAEAVTIAIGAGVNPSDANLTYTDSIYSQAEAYVERFAAIQDGAIDSVAEQGKVVNLNNIEKAQAKGDYITSSTEKLSAEALHARRVLEEVRLHMSVEANRLLLRSNFQINIEPMEKLVNALKTAEATIGERLFGSEDTAVTENRVEIYRQARIELPNIPSLPVATIGEFEGTFTLHQLYESGVERKEDYVKAEERYEMIMTAPRSDMGDSISKAFRNVDDILEDLGFETSEDNRRAVRILGYNAIEITVENIEQVRDLDAALRNTIDKLTPSRVLQLIRDDINPLNMPIDELSDYLDEGGQLESDGKKTDNYAKFLMLLERQGDISDEERTSYIGIYRLMTNLEKRDDAAIGRLMQLGKTTSFSNLLSAMRSMRHAPIDVSIGDDFGGINGMINNKAIDEQISEAFSSDDYIRRIKEIEIAEGKDASIIADLVNMGEPITLDNMEAISSIKQKRGDWAKPITDQFLASLKTKEDYDDEVDEVLGDYVDAVTLYEHYNNLLDGYKNQISNQLTKMDSLLDVKALQSSLYQISMLQRISRDETYDIPTIIDGEVTSVRFTLKHSQGAGKLTVSMETDSTGRIAAEFSFAGQASGYIAYENEDAKDRLEKVIESIKEVIAFVPELVCTSHIDFEKYTDKNSSNEIKNNTPLVDINSTELVRIARQFIGAFRKI